MNYLHNDYKNKYYKLWQKIDVQGIHNCWEMDLKGLNAPKRVCFPSYRTFYSKQKSENVNALKKGLVNLERHVNNIRKCV